MPDLALPERLEHIQVLFCWQSCEDGSSCKEGGKNWQGEWRPWSDLQPPLADLGELSLFSQLATVQPQLRLGSATPFPGSQDRNNSTSTQLFKGRDGTEYCRWSMNPRSTLQPDGLHVLALSRAALSFQQLLILCKKTSTQPRVLDTCKILLLSGLNVACIIYHKCLQEKSLFSLYLFLYSFHKTLRWDMGKIRKNIQ